MAHIDRITFDPAVMGGKACIPVLRVTVSTVVGLLAAGRTHFEILKAYPYLEPEDIDQALAYAAWRIEERDVPQNGGLLCTNGRWRSFDGRQSGTTPFRMFLKDGIFRAAP